MSEPTAAPTAPGVPATSTTTAPAPKHENPFSRAKDEVKGWFDEHGSDVKDAVKEAEVIGTDLEPEFLAFLKTHAAGLFALGAKVYSSPEFRDLEPEVLALIADAGRIVGVTL